MNTPNTAQPFTLPPLPPRPSDTPPSPQQDPNGAFTRAWEASWRIYWQAVLAHQQAAMTASLGTSANTLSPTSQDAIILACAVVIPKHDNERDATWAKRAAGRGRALYAEMQK